MFNTPFRKTLGDLWGNKTRTALVVLSIALGVFAVGLIVGSGVILSREMNRSFAAIRPSNFIVYSSPLDETTAEAVKALPGVGLVEGRGGFFVRVSVGPETRLNLHLTAFPDYSNMPVDKILPDSGQGSPADGEVVFERTSLAYFNVKVGDVLTVETPAGEARQLTVAGTVHDLYKLGPTFDGGGEGYITFNTLESLSGHRPVTSLHIRVAEEASTPAVADQVRGVIEQHGASITQVLVLSKGQHPLGSMIQGIVAVLGVIGLLALALSGFLVVNTLSALMAQQVRYIGILKAIGARRSQIAGMYFSLVMLFGLLALIIAVPLAAVGVRAFSGFIASLLNFDLMDSSLPLFAIGLQFLVAFGAPLLAAFFPVRAGTRITVREALTDYGLGLTAVTRQKNRRLTMSPLGPVTLSISLRNSFRRPARLALTLVTLMLASAISVSVFSVRASLFQTLDQTKAFFTEDVAIDFSDSYPVETIQREALSVPGVTAAESWAVIGSRLVRSDGQESGNITLWAPPIPTQMLQPTVLEGRWLQPGDTQAIVINSYWLKEDPDLQVGDVITLQIKGRATHWTIVGLIQAIPNSLVPTPYGYVPYEAAARVVGETGLASRVEVIAEPHTPNSQAQIATALDAQFKKAGLSIETIMTAETLDTAYATFYNVVVALLLVMAVLLAAVGGLGLMGTMSLNVLERTREIGVLRAIGAKTRTVLAIVVAEGVCLGVASWLLGVVLALPLSWGLTGLVGQVFTRAALSYSFSMGGAAIWLGVMVGIAALASWLPARHAARVTVREALAYE